MFKIDEYGDTEQLVPIKQVALDRCEEEVISFSTPVLVKDLQVNFQHRLSKTEWLNEQSSDPVIGKVLNLLNKNQSHQISNLDDPEFRILWKMKGELCVENKLIISERYSHLDWIRPSTSSCYLDLSGTGLLVFATMIMVIWV